jgi:hypothetical protein
MMVGRVGEQISSRDGMSGPDDLASLEVPPHVGVVEPLADRQHSEHCQQAG